MTPTKAAQQCAALVAWMFSMIGLTFALSASSEYHFPTCVVDNLFPGFLHSAIRRRGCHLAMFGCTIFDAD